MTRKSNDKATRSPIEGLCWVSDAVAPGDEIPYSKLNKSALEKIPCTVITATECGDYSGSGLVGESNYRVMKAEFPWLVEIYGSHGYKSLAYLGKRENQNDALIEAIDSLADYPVYSDDDHSDLEYETMLDQWGSDGQSDFRKALQDILDSLDTKPCTYHGNGWEDCVLCDDTGRLPHEHDLDLISDDDIASLWHDGCDAYGVNGGSGYSNEQGDSIYFHIGDWFEGYARNPERAYNYGDHAGETFSERIKTLAVICRTHETDPALLLVARDAWLQDPNGEHTITLINQTPTDYHAAILYAWELEQAEHEQEISNGQSAGVL